MYIPLKDLRKLEIPVPKNKEYQLQIINILDNIDQKIENCISINKNFNKYRFLSFLCLFLIYFYY